jgi:putative acetyltransferase
MPACQRLGVGSALVWDLIERAEGAAPAMVVVLGNPAYYGRFGFEPAGPLGLWYRPVGRGDPHFQVLRLKNYGTDLTGEYRYSWELAHGGARLPAAPRPPGRRFR